MGLMNKNISFKSFWPMRDNTHTCYHGYQMVCVNIYMADPDRLQDHAPNRFGRWVCVSETTLRSHICYWKSWLLSQTSVTVLGFTATGPVVQAAFTPFIWAQMNRTLQTCQGPYYQVKQVRSESRLTKCPFLIKFNGIYLNKIDQNCHQCAPMLWQKCVV